MRRPYIGIAILLGPAVILAIGTLPACAALTGESTADAGATSTYIPPGQCDVGVTCDQCQTCAGSQAMCQQLLTNCGMDADCVSLSTCMKDCDLLTDGISITDCVTTCCNSFTGDENAISAYTLAANCMFRSACSATCTLQAAYNLCPGVE